MQLQTHNNTKRTEKKNIVLTAAHAATQTPKVETIQTEKRECYDVIYKTDTSLSKQKQHYDLIISCQNNNNFKGTPLRSGDVSFVASFITTDEQLQ